MVQVEGNPTVAAAELAVRCLLLENQISALLEELGRIRGQNEKKEE
jgi:hypothetical protein